MSCNDSPPLPAALVGPYILTSRDCAGAGPNDTDHHTVSPLLRGTLSDSRYGLDSFVR